MHPSRVLPSFLLVSLVALALAVPARPAAAGSDGFTILRLTPLAEGLDGALAIAHAGDERLFVASKGGLVQIWDGARILPEPFLDLSDRVSLDHIERGLLSLVFHPEAAANGRLFVYYSDLEGDIVLARYEVSVSDPNRAEPSSARTVRHIQQALAHYGGSLQFGPDGFLYFGVGDGGEQNDPFCRAQDLGLLQGKILRIDVDVEDPPYWAVPVDNPFVGPGDPPDEVWALGLRNPWRLTFDRATGDLFIADVGQSIREEVNVQPADSPGGENYGWRIMEGSLCFEPDPDDPECPLETPACDDPSFVMPAIEYDQRQGLCAIIGGYVYRGRAIPSLVGRYLYADWCTGKIWAAAPSDRTPSDGAWGGDGAWQSELLPIALPRIRSFGEGPDGEIYLTNGSGLFRLDAEDALFADGFERGDATAWATAPSTARPSPR